MEQSWQIANKFFREGVPGPVMFYLKQNFNWKSIHYKASFKIAPFFLGTSGDLQVPLHSFKSGRMSVWGTKLFKAVGIAMVS